MKPASEWALEFLSKHVLNTRESGEFERFIMEVQKDARSEFLTDDALMKRYPPLKAE
jgi:hypothetical protein